MTEHSFSKPTAPPLNGLVVADFTRVLAGPLATMMLADLGANVIKIERPGNGDETRLWGPPFTAEGLSAYYLSVNRNKRSITLDLNDEQQCAKAREIVLSADVVVENFRADTMQGFDLDFEALRHSNPGLVYCRISGFGNAQGRSIPGYDFMVQALSGLMSITGEPERPPMKTGVAIVDVLTGLHATIGILAALNERQKTGMGQRVDVNLFSSALASLANQASGYLTSGTVPSRISNQHPSIAPYDTFATASTPIVITVGTNSQFHGLCLALDSQRIARDARWSSNANRVQHREELKAAIESILLSHPCDHWLELLQQFDVPCARINNIDQAFELAQELGLQAVQSLVLKEGGEIQTVSNPITLSRTPVTYRFSPPGLGTDSEAVLSWLDNRRKRMDTLPGQSHEGGMTLANNRLAGGKS